MSTQSHYNMAIEPVEFIEKNGLGFSEGNVVKYVSRHDKKDGASDVIKAIDYCSKILKYSYSGAELSDKNRSSLLIIADELYNMSKEGIVKA